MMDKKSFALGVALLAGTATASAEGLGISVNTGLVVSESVPVPILHIRFIPCLTSVVDLCPAKRV